MNNFKKWNIENNPLPDLRKRSELTQRQVAEKLKYTTPQFICNFETGKSIPPDSKILKLSSIYSCDPQVIKDYCYNFKLRKLNEKYQK